MSNGIVEERDRPSINPEVRSDLLVRARAAAERAYAPYSNFPVGAAALASDGSIHTGCNVENASLGMTICAERAAVSAAVGAGHRQIIAVAISAPKGAGATPCGACRQFLYEFRPERTDMVIVLDDQDDGEWVWLDQLLPRAFGPRNLDSIPLAADSGSNPRGSGHGG